MRAGGDWDPMKSTVGGAEESEKKELRFASINGAALKDRFSAVFSNPQVYRSQIDEIKPFVHSKL